MSEISTIEKIHRIAADEFLRKGFRGASLREIVKKAGVTTGAFYGYYKSKEELFSALVKPHADYVSNLFKGLVEQFKTLPFGDVWNYFCESENVPDDNALIGVVLDYEKNVLSKRA